MKASDYIVEYLAGRGVEHVFGYPGGMVTHLMDSFCKYSDRICAHVTYHEQGAAFAACGYAQSTGGVGVAYATSGPGATNMITGICNAYFDSTPVLFITGQVNTFESKGGTGLRQRGFQETDIVSLVKPVTKFAEKVENAERLRWYLDYAFSVATSGRKGPVLLDIPLNVFQADISPDDLEGYTPEVTGDVRKEFPELLAAIRNADRPVFVVGNGVRIADAVSELRSFLGDVSIPTVTSLLAVDTVGDRGYGFIGAYGTRAANFIVAKSDLVVTLGARLSVRQVGANRGCFAPDARIIRVDVDETELEYRVHDDEEQIVADVRDVLEYLVRSKSSLDASKYRRWRAVCRAIQRKLASVDDSLPNRFVSRICELIPDDAVITTDVGQNQIWVAQSVVPKPGQRILFSGGHGAMGYSLPAAVGCALATGKPVYSFNGDGGFQMNIQELQTVVRENLPVKIIVLNNYALGMIRHFQEMYLGGNFCQTVSSGGYTVPDFAAVAAAYGIPCRTVSSVSEIDDDLFSAEGPELVEIKLSMPTYIVPKLEFGKPNQDQEPLLDRALYDELMELNEQSSCIDEFLD